MGFAKTGLSTAGIIRTLVVVTALTLASGCASQGNAATDRPTAASTPQTVAEQVASAVEQYHKLGYRADHYYDTYRSDGDFLKFGKMKKFTGETVRFDPVGVPMIKYGEAFEYNPVTVAHHVLAEHGKFIDGERAARKHMVAGGDRLLAMQGDDGAFRYDFPWTYYLSGQTYEPGWVSAMAQGNAISAFVRLHAVTGDQEYLDAAKKAFDFLLVPISEGGAASTLADFDPSLADHIFFEEYVSEPNAFTLNGYVFTLLGVYDLAESTGDPQAREVFDQGVESLLLVLPRYDVGGFTAYDLGHLTHGGQPHVSAAYHLVHLAVLHALDSIVEEPLLHETLQKWEAWVA